MPQRKHVPRMTEYSPAGRRITVTVSLQHPIELPILSPFRSGARRRAPCWIPGSRRRLAASLVIEKRNEDTRLDSRLRGNDSGPGNDDGLVSDIAWKRGMVWVITILLAVNQFMIGALVPKAQGRSLVKSLRSVFSAQGASAREIIATKLNPDNRTTTVGKWPTITEVPSEPKGVDAVEAAKVVMIATGTPFYAPSGISFDDPVGALAAWQSYEDQIQLSGEPQARWEKITGTMTCDYCCGGPTRVTVINRCGCRHAKAYRSIAKHLLQTVGDKYTDDEILGELQRWKGIWYPKGAIEDYLLATGRVDVMGHQTHGGAGADGMHGM